MGVVPEIVDQVGRADLLPMDGECLRSHQLHETLAQVPDQPLDSHGHHHAAL